MAALKVMLGVFGLLIVGGFAFVTLEIYKRMSDPTHGQAPVEIPKPLEVVLDLGANARIREMLPVGNRVIVLVSLEESSDRLYVLDPVRGIVTSVVTIGGPTVTPPAPQAAN